MRALSVVAICLFAGCVLADIDRGVGTESVKEAEVAPTAVCTTDQQCNPGSICFNGFCVGQGQLRISLSFPTDSDFDLHVATPAGSEISYRNRRADGGELDVDQCISPCGGGTHVENVYFQGVPPSGQYFVWVVNFDGRAGGSFQLETSYGFLGSGSLPAVSGLESQVFTLNL